MSALAHKDEDRIPCKWCGTPTQMLGTKMCDGCWELETRIQSQPDLARRILDDLESESQVTELMTEVSQEWLDELAKVKQQRDDNRAKINRLNGELVRQRRSALEQYDRLIERFDRLREAVKALGDQYK